MNKAEAKVDNFTQYSYTSITFISFTGRYEHIFDKLPTAVASYLSWLGHRTGIASSRVQLPLKSWIFFSFLRSCINCVDTTARIILHLILNKSLYFVNPFVGLVQKFTGMLEQSIRLIILWLNLQEGRMRRVVCSDWLSQKAHLSVFSTSFPQEKVLFLDL